MTTEATATQGFHQWDPADQQRWAREQLRAYGIPPIAGGEAADAIAQPGTGQGDPPADGGTGEAKGGDGFNWGLFPNVPEDQRPLLEPHLKDVQAHVTKLEQSHAPFKDVDPNQVKELTQFAQALEKDPVEVWLQLGERIAEAGNMADLDYDALRSIATGQDVDDDPGTTDETGGEGEVPPWAEELRSKLESIEGETKAEKQARTQRVEQEFLNRQIGGIRSKLSEAGLELPEGPDGDKEIVARLIVNNGDVEAVSKSFTDTRDAALKGFAEKGKAKKGELEVADGGPKPPKDKGGQKDSWGQARAGASNYLGRVQEAEAQE